MCCMKQEGYSMEKGRQSVEHQQLKWRRKGKKDHALMHKIRAIEHDRTRRRPVNENRFEVWLQLRIWRVFFPCWSQSESALENTSVPEIHKVTGCALRVKPAGLQVQIFFFLSCLSYKTICWTDLRELMGSWNSFQHQHLESGRCNSEPFFLK